jgi:hypothetical protein
VLLVADADLSAEETKGLAELLQRRHGHVKLIFVDGNARAVIVKTTNAVAPLLRAPEGRLTAGGKALKPVLTSGAVGKLKRRASETARHGQVP